MKHPDTRSAMEQSTCLASVERGALFFDNGIEMLWKTQGEATSIHSDVKMVKEEMIHAATYLSCGLVTKKPELLTLVSVQPIAEDHVDHTITECPKILIISRSEVESKSGDGDCKHAER